MSKKQEVSPMKTMALAFAALSILSLTVGMLAQPQKPAATQYSWHASLVSFDENARTVTLKAPIVSDRVGKDFEPIKTGDRIVLRWSGFHDSANSIAQAMRWTELDRAEDYFTFPVEFVSFDPARRFVTFKVEVPESSIANLKLLKTGDWVTATSPHGPSSKTTPISAIRPYGPDTSMIKAS
jgi:hypothetical protein